jgi:hypothetical protein
MALLLAAAGCSSIDLEREKQFDDALPAAHLTILPTLLRSGSASSRFDAALSEQIAEHLRQHGVPVASCPDQPALAVEPGVNQLALWRANAHTFAEYVRDHKLIQSNAYALQPELLLDGRGRPIGVHLYVSDFEGRIVGGLLLNSHNDNFQRVNPQNTQDGIRLLLIEFDGAYLEQPPTTQPSSSTTSPAP